MNLLGVFEKQFSWGSAHLASCRENKIKIICLFHFYGLSNPNKKIIEPDATGVAL